MTTTLTDELGPIIETESGGVNFSVPEVLWSRGGDEDEYEGPDAPGLLIALSEDLDGTVRTRTNSYARPRRFRLLNVFDVDDLSDPVVEQALVDAVLVNAGSGVPVYGAFHELEDASSRRKLIAGIRGTYSLSPPFGVRFLMQCPPSRRAAILRHYPAEVDMDEHRLWEAVDESIRHIDD